MTEKSSGAAPAFPTMLPMESAGLSKREHFAALILAGLNAGPFCEGINHEQMAAIAVEQADLLLAQLALRGWEEV